MIFKILFGSLILCYLFMRFKYRRFYELSRQLNNDILTLPFLGHLYLFIGNGEDLMNAFKYFGKKALNNGGMSALWLGTKLLTVIADPVIADYLSKTCLEKDNITQMAQYLIGNGSIFAPVSIWRPRRKLVSLNFSLPRLNHFVDIFSQQGLILVNTLKRSEGKQPISLFKYLIAYSMDSVCESTLGIKLSVQNNSEHPFPKAFEYQCRIYIKHLFQPYIYDNPFYKLTPAYAKFTKNNQIMRDFVKKMMTNKSDGEQGLSDLEILEELLVLFVAGTDTSATGAAFVGVMLSRHPEVQDKVYNELQELFGDSDKHVTAKDLTQLKYLEAVVKETLRLYPPVPITMRMVDQDVTIPSGITLVKDSTLLIHNWAINRNPEYWGEDAEEFRPERFFDDPPKHSAAFASFSLGPRNCLGYKYALMAISTVTIHLVRNFKLVLPGADINLKTGKCLDKEKPLRVKFEVMMKDVDDFKVRLVPRTK
ncbi:hypothetical protein O3G_MSEX013042 [Manduca sexta]|uniref:Cytochrome P450 n=2 Tax=Manduca sexta TaxID=7130 RepID=A0A921ZQ76_MANSE|nr:hypothetical protein O3G_MSEX013042 [Manduca sexta]